MNKKVLAMILLAALIFIGGIIGSAFIMKKTDNQLVTVIQDGKEIYRFNLAETEDQEITVTSPDGDSFNVIAIKNGEISISDAGCPDKTCVKTGTLSSEHLPIVCLPNKLIIRFCEEGK